MKIYFDTEFTGLHKNTSLISIGLIAEDDSKFYAELEDYDVSQVDTWLEDNVIKHLYKNNGVEIASDVNYIYGTKTEVRDALYQWLTKFDEIQFVADVCHYDFVLLIDLFGSAFDMPENCSKTCHDINQDIAQYKGISEIEAFDLSREQLLEDRGITVTDGDKHNALYDALVTKHICEDLLYTPLDKGIINKLI